MTSPETISDWYMMLPEDEMDRLYQLYQVHCESRGEVAKLDEFVNWLEENYGK